MTAKPYYPPLSELLPLDRIPSDLEVIGSSVTSLLDGLYYRNLFVEKSRAGDLAFYQFELVLYRSLGLSFPGAGGLAILINPSEDSSGNTVIPVTFDYEWPILKYVTGFDLTSFQAAAANLFDVFLDLIGATREELLAEVIRVFIDDPSPINRFIADFNAKHKPAVPLTLSVSTGVSVYEVIIAQLKTAPNQFELLDVVLSDYIVSLDLNVVFERLLSLANHWLGEITREDFERLLTPAFRFRLPSLTIGVRFPRNVLREVDAAGKPLPDPQDPKADKPTLLTFDLASVEYSTDKGLEFNLAQQLEVDFPRSEILKSGITIGFDDLKIDLSRTTSIPEAIADGRPADFVGVYAQNATIGLPAFWKKDNASKAEIVGKNLLIGTGGISGTIGLDIKNGSLFEANLGAFTISLDAFDLTFKQNSITDSSIKGKLLIPGFEDSNGGAAKIDIGVHIGGDGDFEVTAAVAAGVPIGFKDLFTFDIKEARVGRKGERFYFAVAGTLEFGKALGQFLPDKVEIQKLLIWDDGKFEFEGGKIALPRAITLSIGPVNLSVTGLGLGSHEQEHGGHLRQYRYFTFDGGVNVNPGGVDVSASGVAFYYTVDDDETGLPAHRFLRIQSIAVDMAIPSGSSKDDAVLLLKGYLAMREAKAPSTGTEYAGSVAFTLPKLKMSGAASMRLNPSVPAFIIDVGLEIATPILLGSTGLGIWGFRGLAGLRYIATKKAADVDDAEPWWKYYKAKIKDDYREGIQVSKFEQTRGFSLGAGVSLATASDGGKAFSSKIFFLLSVPEVFLLQGQGQILKGRILLTDTTDPPFFALIAITRSSIEAAFGVKYAIPAEGDKPGGIATVDGVIEMGFSWGNSTAWYINIGRETPASQRIGVRLLSIIDAYFYFMMSNSGIRAGAGASYHLSRKFGPLKAELHAYLDTAGHISFQRSQIGASIHIGGSLELSIFGIGFGFSAAASLAAEGTKPYTVVGTLEVCVRVLRKDRCARFEFSWIFNQDLDTTETKLLKDNLRDSGKALNIHTHETYELWTGGAAPVDPTGLAALDACMIPMDSYIDIEFLKGVLPSTTVLKAFGGNTMGSGAIEYVAPQRGKNDRVRHEYTLDSVEILYYDGGWKPYDVHGAAVQEELEDFVTTDPATLRQGFWQYQQPNLHNRLRVLAPSPLTYVSQGSGDFVPEDSGITVESIFCAPKPIAETCTNFKAFPPGAAAPATLPAQRLFFHGQLQFRIIGADGSVVDHPLGGLTRAVKLESGSSIEIFPVQPAVSVRLKLRTTTDTAVARFYCRVPVPPAGPNLPVTQYTYALVGTKPIPRREVIQSEAPFEDSEQLVEVLYQDIEQPVDKIVIEAGVCSVDPPLDCGTEVTITALQLERFLHTLVERGQLLVEEADLLVECNQPWDGIFLNTSLHAVGIPEVFVRWSALSSTGTELHGEVTNWLGFRCPIDLTLVDGGPLIDWTQLIRLYNIRADLTAPTPGANRKFFIDGEVRTAKGTRKVTLRGTSCYEVARCGGGSPFDPGPVTDYAITLGDFLSTLAADNRLVQPRVKLSPAEVIAFDSAFLTGDHVVVPAIRKVWLTTAVTPGAQRLDMLFEEEPNRGTVSLTLPQLAPGFTFDAVTGLSNLRPDLTRLHAGANSDFLIDARVRGADEESSVTLRGVASLTVTTATLTLGENNPSSAFGTFSPHEGRRLSNGTSPGEPGNEVAFGSGGGSPGPVTPHECALFLYEVCVLDYAAASFNDTLPAQSSVDAEVASIVNAFQGSIPVLWSPNKRYAIRVKTTDHRFREDGQSILASTQRTSVFGFRTVGPLGHFHIYPDGNGKLVPRQDYADLEAKGRADEFRLAGLLHYIDFAKSYPNADGQLLNAKPLFYADAKLLLFYLQTYVARMFSDWKGVGNLEGANAVFEVTIKDPAPDPKAAAAGAVEASWEVSPLPIVSRDLAILNNMIKHGKPCSNVTEIKPTWLYSEFPLRTVNLQPLKLYTAVFNLRFKKEKETSYVTRELLHYAFQTSAYASLAEQVDSYKLEVATDGTVLKRAVFDVVKDFSAPELAAATSVLKGSLPAGDPLLQQFAEPLNRLLEGALKLEAMHPPRGTEFNVLRDETTKRILGVLVKNPEPFNDPKIPEADVRDSIRLSVNGGDPALYQAIYSKDLSQAFLTNEDDSMSLPPGATCTFTFTYKQWNGAKYENDKTAQATVVLS